MTETMTDLLRIPPNAPLAWPSDWPEEIGAVARIEHGKLHSMHLYHRDEPVDEPLLRAAGRQGREGVGVSPELDGWNPARSSDTESDIALKAIRMIIEKDGDFLEQAQDFKIEYDYASSEGKKLSFPPLDEADNSDEDEPPAVPAPVTRYVTLPIDGIRFLKGTEIRNSASGALAIDIPYGHDIREIPGEDVHAAPWSDRLALRFPGDDRVPATIILPRSILKFLPSVAVPGPVRMWQGGDWLSLGPAIDPADQEDPSAALPAREINRPSNAILGWIVRFFLILAAGAFIAAIASIFMARGTVSGTEWMIVVLDALPRWLDLASGWFGGETDAVTSDPVTDIRRGLFEAEAE